MAHQQSGETEVTMPAIEAVLKSHHHHTMQYLEDWMTHLEVIINKATPGNSDELGSRKNHLRHSRLEARARDSRQRASELLQRGGSFLSPRLMGSEREPSQAQSTTTSHNQSLAASSTGEVQLGCMSISEDPLHLPAGMLASSMTGERQPGPRRLSLTTSDKASSLERSNQTHLSLASLDTKQRIVRVAQEPSVNGNSSVASSVFYDIGSVALATSRERLRRLIDDPDSSRQAYRFERFMLLLTGASVIMALLQVLLFQHDDEQGNGAHRTPRYLVDVAFELVFLAELCIRLLLCSSIRGFLISVFNVVDLIAAVPICLRPLLGCVPWNDDYQGIGGDHSKCMKLLAVVPAIRLFKVVRRIHKFQLLSKAFRLTFDALPIFVFIHLSLFLLFSGAIFVFEPSSNIHSYSEACWLTVVSMTTLGYGDFTPVSTMGRLAVGLLTFTSMLYTGIPIGIIGSVFTEVWGDRDRILLINRTKRLLEEKGYTAKNVPDLFAEYDVDRDGVLNLNEFLWMLRRLNLGLKKDRVGQLFRSFDLEGRGTIDDRQFVRGIFPDSYYAIYKEAADDSMLQRQSGQSGSALDVKRARSGFGIID